MAVSEAKLAKFKKIITKNGAVIFSFKSPNPNEANGKKRCIVAGEIAKKRNKENVDYFKGYIDYISGEISFEYQITPPAYWELKKLLCPKDYQSGAMHYIEIENEYLDLFETLFIIPDTLINNG